MVLLERESFKVILRDTKACLSACLELVKKYRDTPEAGRTHVVHAISITFGYKAAVWAEELGRQVNRLESMKERIFMGEMAGAVGTLNIPQQVYRLSEKAVPPFRGKCTAYPPRCTAHSLGYDVKII